MATYLLAKIIFISIYTLYTLTSVSTFSILFFKYIYFGTDKENSLGNQSFFGWRVETRVTLSINQMQW